jgi:hypothetical protein
MRLFVDILDLIKANQPIELLLTENTVTILGSMDGRAIKILPQKYPSPVSENTECDSEEKVV